MSLICILLLLVGENPETPYRAFDQGDYATALVGLRPLVERGDAKAQYFLARMHLEGFGVRQDSSKAVALLKLASRQEYPDAQIQLADLHFAGEHGVEKNFVKAAELSRASAKAGHVRAAFTYAWMLHRGLGVKVDDAAADKWYLVAAKAGHGLAQTSYALRLLRQPSTPERRAEAIRWLKEAAGQGLAVAQMRLGCCLARGQHCKKDAKKASEWFERAAAQGSARAMFELADLYLHGDGVEQNRERMVELLKASANKGYVVAMFGLGQSYEEGHGGPVDLALSYRWYTRASKKGHLRSKTRLGLMLIDGRGTERKAAEGIKLIESVALAGEPEAQRALARVLDNGSAGYTDPVTALAWARVRERQLGEGGRQLRQEMESKLSLKQRDMAAAIVAELEKKMAD